MAAHAGELRVNVGGDPGQDDYGLPPVDVEIPDDARELDRDVQAYRRELRAQRRRMVASRLSGPFMRDGVALPVIAGCLALTLLAGALLAVFTADRSPFGPVPHATTAQARYSPAPGEIDGLLPDTIVVVDGQPVSLRDLAGPVLVLALIPPSCRCLAHLRRLAGQAAAAGAETYLAATDGTRDQALSKEVHPGRGTVLQDPHNALATTYRPATLTAIVVRADGTVASIVADPAGGFQLQAELASLSSIAHQ
jgi:hypothetical protein